MSLKKEDGTRVRDIPTVAIRIPPELNEKMNALLNTPDYKEIDISRNQFVLMAIKEKIEREAK